MESDPGTGPFKPLPCEDDVDLQRVEAVNRALLARLRHLQPVERTPPMRQKLGREALMLACGCNMSLLLLRAKDLELAISLSLQPLEAKENRWSRRKR